MTPGSQVQCQQVPGRQLAHRLDECRLARAILPGDELGEGVDVELPRHDARGEDGLQLGAPDQALFR